MLVFVFLQTVFRKENDKCCPFLSAVRCEPPTSLYFPQESCLSAANPLRFMGSDSILQQLFCIFVLIQHLKFHFNINILDFCPHTGWAVPFYSRHSRFKRLIQQHLSEYRYSPAFSTVTYVNTTKNGYKLLRNLVPVCINSLTT